jgi:catechol 2,3-dioxygenase-like lactoylglutathione lyase family enzyme
LKSDATALDVPALCSLGQGFNIKCDNKEIAMFNHVMLGASDLEASKKFYDATLAVLGVKPGFAEGQRYFYMTKEGTFGISTPIDGQPACGANGGTIGFKVEDEAMGDAWHAAGLANGGTACEDPPGIREGAMGKMYLAYLRDPSGNKICVVKRIG